jgi:hypothetical protein
LSAVAIILGRIVIHRGQNKVNELLLFSFFSLLVFLLAEALATLPRKLLMDAELKLKLTFR